MAFAADFSSFLISLQTWEQSMSLIITISLSLSSSQLYINSSFFLSHSRFKFDKLADFAGGTNFVFLAIITLAFSGSRGNARNIVASLFIMTWGARLSGFLRILKTGKND